MFQALLLLLERTTKKTLPIQALLAATYPYNY